MNLYLRLLVIWLRTAFVRRQHPFIPTTTRFRVRPWEIDLFGHMNNGRYLQIMDLARVDWMRRCGVADVAVSRRWGALLGGQLIRFRRALKPLQAYSVHTRLLGWDERWFFIEHRFENAEGQLVSVAISRAALRGKGQWVDTAEMAGAVIPGTPSPALPAAVREWLAADELMDELPATGLEDVPEHTPRAADAA
ncbi:thioesterase family protein [Alkalilimnicola sp. S0819]|uniref:thioesterase family protein n=1 Tax=Alkalilimnicola sp. S0819 TaxID=2613922 RepID=UPI001261D719|nr:acyl-CoA thioesterase [Alkalilimnicola sp. S0819]KAB7624072.1 thioesterase [Alkalilimnicola sp. S0819]MPQ16322.1 thioesterase [Alkalilimnicola sp. S0819]